MSVAALDRATREEPGIAVGGVGDGSAEHLSLCLLFSALSGSGSARRRAVAVTAGARRPDYQIRTRHGCARRWGALRWTGDLAQALLLVGVRAGRSDVDDRCRHTTRESGRGTIDHSRASVQRLRWARSGDGRGGWWV